MVRIPLPEVPLQGSVPERSAQLRGMGFGSGPGNPNVTPGGSPQAQEWRTLRGGPPNMGPQLPAAQAPAAPVAPTATPTATPAAAPTKMQRLAKGAGAAGVAATGVGMGYDALRGQATPTEAYTSVLERTTPGWGERMQGNSKFLQKLGVPEAVADGIMDLRTRLSGVPTEFAAKLVGAPIDAVNAVSNAGLPSPTQLFVPPAAAAAAPAATPQAGHRDEGRNYPLATTASELRAPNLAGKIVRNGNSYSGSNIEFGTDIVDPQGRLVNGGDPNKPKGFGVTSLDTSAGHQANLRELASLRAEATERAAGFAANQPGGGLTGMSTRSLVDDVVARHGTRDASAEAGLSARQRANLRMQEAELAQRGSIAGMQNAATLRGQNIGADTSRYGVDTGAATARRGQDMDYREKIDARMMDLMAKQQLRGASAEAFKQFGGDMRKFAAWQAANGMSPDGALSVQKYGDERAAAGSKMLSEVVAPRSLTPDGKISEGAVATNKLAAQKALRLPADATPEQIAAAGPSINSVGKLIDALNATRDTDYLRALGLDHESPAHSTMPDLRGYSLGDTGFFEGAFTPGVSRGDYKLEKKGAKPIYLRRDGLDESDLATLRDTYGVRLPGK